ncbi:MAG: hypothetical protein JST08_20160 [Actinobacteria bacterium]|nr:hypothetical protein [Actinomycetota bacterium]
MKLSALAAIVVCAALFVAGCGGGGSGGSNATTPPTSGATNGGGTPKQATSPNAPAGSRVVACAAGAAEMKGLRATAVDCGTARATMIRWGRTSSCGLADGASRGSCSLGDFRCQAVKADRGIAVSCAQPGGDVAFIATEK